MQETFSNIIAIDPSFVGMTKKSITEFRDPSFIGMTKESITEFRDPSFVGMTR